MQHNKPLSIYIHWPFCLSKCPYCDFNSHVAQNIDYKAWEKTYLSALSFYAQKTKEHHVISIYFGGGTPSLMQPDLVENILEYIHQCWSVDKDVEITMEANPTSVEIEKLSDFKVAGINRLSLGVQSLDDAALKFLGREHSAIEALQALSVVQKLFDRYSFDLIYTRPEQKLAHWREELQKALSHAGGHMSLYQLTIEEGTQFFLQHKRGDFVLPDEEDSATFFEETEEIMAQANLPSYEVSNYATLGQESRHNLTYWRYGDYIGIGPGAHGRISFKEEKWSTRGHRAPDIWLKGKEIPLKKLTPSERGLEALLMGLRLREGIPLSRIGQGIISKKRLAMLEKEKLLQIKNGRLIATRSGMLRLNSVLAYIIVP